MPKTHSRGKRSQPGGAQGEGPALHPIVLEKICPSTTLFKVVLKAEEKSHSVLFTGGNSMS